MWPSLQATNHSLPSGHKINLATGEIQILSSTKVTSHDGIRLEGSSSISVPDIDESLWCSSSGSVPLNPKTYPLKLAAVFTHTSNV